MKTFFTQLRWQFLLLHKNNIINISLGVTVVYGLILYALRNVGSLNEFLVALVMNDPSVIGYFFIGLALYTEIKYQVLSAVLVSPISVHQLILSKVMALTIIGVVCSLGLAISVLGFDFDLVSFTLGSAGICTLSALLGIGILTFSSEFLKFTLLSVPIFLVFINVPLLQYLNVIEIGAFKYCFPVQGGLDLIDSAISGSAIHQGLSYLSMAVFIPIFYAFAYWRFNKKLVS